jgi:predicted 2-oxoglutarate/Fe(II)-dependent dioxygenase YbiX
MSDDFIFGRPMASPQSFRTSHFALWTTAECDRIVGSLPEAGWAPVDQHRDGTSFRSVELQRPDFMPFPELHHRMLAGLEGVNSELYRFDVSGVAEFDPPHAVRYQPGQGHYGWHTDSGEGHPLRKLSLVVLMNEPDEFEGGELEIKGWGCQQLEQGRAIVFPSYFWHQVRPVTRGRRIVLVAWCQGPSFR